NIVIIYHVNKSQQLQFTEYNIVITLYAGGYLATGSSETVGVSHQTHFAKNSGDKANILILHPIYAGSHELTLRKFGEELVKRGHKVTQLRWKSTKTQEVISTVEVLTLRPDNHDLR
ncbi:hypothetical protein SK128_006603, partial [Halocaridina rubra]